MRAYLASIGAPDDPSDEANLQSLCVPCHSAKTANEDAGFANRRALPLQVEWNLGQWKGEGGVKKSPPMAGVEHGALTRALDGNGGRGGVDP